MAFFLNPSDVPRVFATRTCAFCRGVFLSWGVFWIDHPPNQEKKKEEKKDPKPPPLGLPPRPVRRAAPGRDASISVIGKEAFLCCASLREVKIHFTTVQEHVWA